MRNLRLYHKKLIRSELINQGTAFCIDCEGDVAYFCEEEQSLYKINLQNPEEVVKLVNYGDHLSNAANVPKPKVIGMAYLYIQSSVCFSLDTGNVFLFNLTTSELEEVGNVASGICSMGWSPDQDVVAFVTGRNSTIVMNSDFVVITEVALYQEDGGEVKPVTIGWGCKETQFHGSEGKSAAVVKKSTTQPVFEFDDRMPRISWRGDAQYFVVSAIRNTEPEVRMLHIFNSVGVLQFMSEYVNGLEQGLCWSPNGVRITCTQRTDDNYQVVFFESNGLRHREFQLPVPAKEVKVSEIIWNCDSTILVLWCESLESEVLESRKSFIQLWTSSNYHWYLKQEFDFSNDIIKFVAWDAFKDGRLHIVCEGGIYHQYNWKWEVDHSRGNTKSDKCNVAVVDGVKVLMTPFRQTVIPPPKSAYEIRLLKPVTCVIFPPRKSEVLENVNTEDSGVEFFDSPGEDSNNICVLDCSGKMNFLVVNMDESQISMSRRDVDPDPVTVCYSEVVGKDGFCSNITCHVLLATYYIQPILDKNEQLQSTRLQDFYNWSWITQDLLVACFIDQDSMCKLCVLDIKQVMDDVIKVRAVIPCSEPVISISSSPDGMVAALQYKSGLIGSLNTSTLQITPWLIENIAGEMKYAAPCCQVEIITLRSGRKWEKLYILIGLNEHKRLYINNVQVSDNCTGFAIHSEFIVYLTTAHTVRCVALNYEAIEEFKKGNITSSETARNIERGSRIVVAVPQDTRIVLQMPRGNLEIISPRTLVLDAINYYMNFEYYLEAFKLMRKQRINLNLLVDHNDHMFYTNTKNIIKSIDNPSWIGLFIADLSNEDVSHTMYASTFQNISRCNSIYPGQRDKLDSVCNHIREVLINVDENKYMLPILTTYVKKTTSELDMALKKVKEIKDGTAGEHITITADECLKHLLYFVDVDELYNVALGTYDFDLVIMVAEKSQKDPKEYIPFLNNLKNLSEPYRYFAIDKFLKRNKLALTRIVQCEDKFEECLEFINEHKLYNDALELYPIHSTSYKLVSVSFGDYLHSHSHYEDAGLSYYKGGELGKALNSLRKGGCWQQCLAVADELEYSGNQKHELCQTLVSSLLSNNQFRDAAIILEQYLENYEESIDVLIKGFLWDDALRILYKYKRIDIVETHLKPNLLERMETLSFTISQMKEQLEEYVERFFDVIKAKQIQGLNDLADDDIHPIMCDIFSDTSSVASDGATSIKSAQTSSSRSSNRSSKSRKKKQQRKKLSLKQGSQYEELGLMAEIHDIIKNGDALKEDVYSINKMLVRFGMEQQAYHLQCHLKQLMEIATHTRTEIWNEEVLPFRTGHNIVGPQSTSNSIAAALQKLTGKTNLDDIDDEGKFFL